MGKYLLLLLSLLSLAKASNGQTNCRSECIASGKSHICQWETICDPVIAPTPEPTPTPTPSPTPEPAPEPTPLPPTPAPEPYPLPPQSVPFPPETAPSILNPTNPLSILNPNSPLNPPTVPLQTPQTNMDGNDAQEIYIPPIPQTNTEETSNGKTFVPGFGLVLSLELMVKPGIVQPNLFPDQYIGQEMPNDYKYQMHDLYAVGDPNTFSRLIKDTVELQQ